MQITLEEINGSGELWLDIMKIICGDTPEKDYSSMCDLMCHKAPYTPQLGFWDRKFVDIQNRDLDFPDEKLLNFVQKDVIEFLMSNTTFFDVTICSDGIEHLTKENGEELLWWMKNQSDKQIIFTPMGEASITKDGHPDSHASGWMPEDFEGWVTIALPNFHESINLGAFFAINCSDNIDYEAAEEKQRIYNEIKIKYAFYDKD